MMNKLQVLFAIILLSVFMASAQELPIQNGVFNTCGPNVTFTDSGGATGNYSSDEDFTMTICPDIPDELIVLDFTTFSTQEDTPSQEGDVLRIYNGDDTTAPLIGEFSGTNSPVLVIGNNETGCLTLRFTSNGFGNTIGWLAQLECTPNCQDIEPIISNTNPAPDVNGNIVIPAGTNVAFNATANFSVSSEGAIYTWDWGDGTTGFGQNTTHTYNLGGSYTAILTVSDNNPVGCSESVSINVIVEDSVITANSPAFAESSYGPEDLIREVLVSGGCSEVDNFEFQYGGAGADDLANKSYGYFTRGGSNFPFEEGIVLSTGRVSPAGNSSSSNLVSFNNGIGGDSNLDDALGVINSSDATFIKFNFTPTAESIAFRFIMASEEYSGDNGNFECLYSDGFAFLLRELGTTSYENLAVLPNGDEVTVPNISAYPSCQNNPEFFAGYNDEVFVGGVPGDLTDTNFNGRTEVLVASASVTPGVTYEIKLVVSDLGVDGNPDQIYDSAVFIEAGSFNLGGDLGDDITIANGNAPCGGNDVELNTRAPDAVHTWYKDGVEIPGVTGPTYTVTEAGVYSVDVEFGVGCEVTDSIIVEFREAPVLEAEPENLSNCSTGATATFDLELNTPIVLGAQDPADFLVTYHNTFANARDGINPIPNSSSYSGTNGETIYVRIVDTASGICFVVSEFTLEVFSEVIATSASVAQCDNSLDGDDTNGFAEFDLTQMDGDVLGGLDPGDYAVSYYRNQADADGRVNPIVSPYTNTVVNADQVVARVENIVNIDCYGTAIVDLVVDALPVLDNAQVELRQCDNDTDGFSDFNLTESERLISSNFENEIFTYHLSQADAQSGSNAIADPLTYTNTDPSSNADQLYVRVSNAAGCYRVAELDLLVSTTQIPANFELVYEECDGYDVDNDNTNGIERFDFSDATAQIEALYPSGQNITVSYYQSIEDALSETNAIGDISNYRNESSPFEQVLVVRVDSDVDNSCLGLGEHIVLRTINPQPNLDPADLILCDDTNPGDMSELFDLTQNEVYILNGEADVVASYHNSIADAESGANAIATPTAYANTSTVETIYVRVSNSITGCYARVEFDIQVNPLPDVVAISNLLACERNTDGIFDFDLQTKTTEALGGQDPSIYQVSYHQSQADADNLSNPLASPYANLSNPQTIYVAITNTQTGCSVSSQTFDLVVQEAAEANPDGQPILYEICDNVNANDGFGQFDLSTVSDQVLDGQDPVDFSLTYHASMEDALNDENPLPLLYENLSNPQIIYARVSNVIAPNECFEVGPLTLQVNLLPTVELEEQYVLCITTNGTEVVETPPVIDTGLSGTQYQFDWYYNGDLLVDETAPSIIAMESGDYEVVVTDIGTSQVTSCSSSASTVVIESEPPMLTAEVTSVSFSSTHTIEAMATGIGDYEYSLDNGLFQPEGVFEDVSLGVHTVTARDRKGCGITTVEVTVMDYPRYFTPNGDGLNEQWQITGIENQPNAKIYIFDRYGKLLAQLSPTGQGWDGTYNGSLMPSDDYWFTIDYIEPSTGDPKVFKAHFTLKR